MDFTDKKTPLAESFFHFPLFFHIFASENDPKKGKMNN